MKKDIAVCPHCEEPMVWTFIYRGSEWYCVACGRSYGMLSARRVEYDKKLALKSREYKRIFRTVSKNILVPGAWYDKCKKCEVNRGPYHIQHATEEEKQKDKIARSFLTRLKWKR